MKEKKRIKEKETKKERGKEKRKNAKGDHLKTRIDTR